MATTQIFAFLWQLLLFVYAAVVLVTIAVVILNNRSPVKTLTWVLVLFFLPVAGLVLFFFFGRDNRKKRLIGRRSLSKLLQKSLNSYETQQHSEYDGDCIALIQFFKNVNMSLPFEHNEVQFLTDGFSMLQTLLREIASAKHHIHIQFYIFMNDSVGRLVRDALIDKAAQGVEVRLLYDDVGCWSVKSRFFDEMRAAGVDVRGFMRVRFPQFTSRVNYRNHRKLVVIDGKTAFVGGMNIADRYIKGVTWGCWRDIMLLIRGCAVYGLQTSFLADWFFTDGSLITAKKYYPPMPKTGGATIQIVTSQPIGEWRDIMQGYILAINRSHRYVYMQTPYFLPTEPVLSALQNVALSGADVRLMIPQRSDSLFTQLASFSFLGDVLKAGVKVYLYHKGFLHSKLMVCDDALSTVGSTNVDFRSFELNFEVNAFIYDTVAAKRLKELFLEDQKDCELLSLKSYEERSRKQKAEESLIRLMAPIL